MNVFQHPSGNKSCEVITFTDEYENVYNIIVFV